LNKNIKWGKNDRETKGIHNRFQTVGRLTFFSIKDVNFTYRINRRRVDSDETAWWGCGQILSWSAAPLLGRWRRTWGIARVTLRPQTRINVPCWNERKRPGKLVSLEVAHHSVQVPLYAYYPLMKTRPPLTNLVITQHLTLVTMYF